MLFLIFSIFFFFNDTATTEIYTLSLHDALPISHEDVVVHVVLVRGGVDARDPQAPEFTLLRLAVAVRVLPTALDVLLRRLRSEEHTSELQSPCNLVCRLLLEKKKHTPCSHTPSR